MKALRKGYSLTEAMIVMAIISLLLSIIVVNALPLLLKVKRMLGGL